MSIDNETLMTFGDGDDTLLSPTGMPPTPLIPGEPIVEEKKKRRRNVVGLGMFCRDIFIFLHLWCTSSAVDRGFEPRSGKTKDNKIGICCFSAKHAALRRKSTD